MDNKGFCNSWVAELSSAANSALSNSCSKRIKTGFFILPSTLVFQLADAPAKSSLNISQSLSSPNNVRDAEATYRKKQKL